MTEGLNESCNSHIHTIFRVFDIFDRTSKNIEQQIKYSAGTLCVTHISG